MKKFLPIVLLFILSFWAYKPLLVPGFFSMHDNTQVVRVQQMTLSLSQGQFPVRWVADLGYGFGYPLFNFYAPLPYYFGAIFALLGFDFLLATKIMFLAGIILVGVTMYFLAREFWGEWGGMIAGLFAIYGPYHAVDVYVRGAVGEFWAMGFVPLVFLGLAKIAKGSKKGILIGSLGFAGVILSHNLTALMLAPFIALVFLIGLLVNKSQSRLTYSKHFLLLIFFGLGLAAFYWLPALVEMNLTQVAGQIGGGADFKDHFVYLDQLWASPWGFGGSAPGRLDGMSFMLGKLHLVIIPLSLLILFLTRKIYPFLIAYLILFISLFLTTNFSSPLWNLWPGSAFIQYPWRFLLFATLASSFLAGSIFLFSKKTVFRLVAGLGLGLILILFNTKYFRSDRILNVSASDYLNEEKIKWDTSKISDEYLPRDFIAPKAKEGVAWQKLDFDPNSVKVVEEKVTPTRYDFKIEATQTSPILVNVAYFPGWQVFLDNRRWEFEAREGKIELQLPRGEHQLLVKLTDTLIRKAANFVTLVWLGLLGLFLLKYR